MKKIKTEADAARREDHMVNAGTFAAQLCREAEMRGVSGFDLVQAFAGVLAARNPTLAGKVLLAVEHVILHHPVTKVFKPTDAEVLDISRQVNGSHGADRPRPAN